ncbi:MAG: PRTRC system ThiF family protein, partial [Bacteroidetes bacterium]|nr:PRTRC system ThiF family protein [Bacteroidota bacterium]
MNNLPAIHFVDNYLINPPNPIIINLIGIGGTGSRMLSELATIHAALLALGHPGLMVYVYDDDRIAEPNLGRQRFAESELGLYKSVAAVNRINRFFGTDWKAVTYQFNSSHRHKMPLNGKANLYISCVDTVKARFEIADFIGNTVTRKYERNRPLYWMDLGNSKDTGQVILATIGDITQPESKRYRTVAELPKVTDEFKDLLLQETGKNEPSCSLAEAIEKQDLFINPAVALFGAELLFRLFRTGMTDIRGAFINLKNFKT